MDAGQAGKSQGQGGFCLCATATATPGGRIGLNWGSMSHFLHLRRLATAGLACALLATVTASAQGVTQDRQDQKPLVLKPDVPGTSSNHRLILKDGSYQIVRQYEIVGDRVRYISVERSGGWEELPVSLVDWDATRKWEQEHASEAGDASPAMKEAEELDKEEAAARADERNRMPEVAKGLELPDSDGVYVLDTYQGTPELVELVPTTVNTKSSIWHGLSTLNPMAGSRAHLELDGAHAKVHLHVNDPEIYLSLDGRDEVQPILSDAVTVQTSGAKQVANARHGAQSASSVFAIVHLDERRAVRIVGAIHVSPTGEVTQSEDVIATKVEVLPGKHWLKLTPEQPMLIGEYALVEILSPAEMNQSIWDFRVDPSMGDNLGSLGPILK